MGSGMRISSELKAEIVQTSLKPEAVLSTIASDYGVSEASIHKWSKDYNVPSKTPIVTENLMRDNFVELSLKNNASIEKPKLKSASLVFKDYSLCIEGNLNPSSLLKIVHILVESC